MAQWKAGADTCVFKPAVRCNGESQRRAGVSRIRTADAAKRDLVVEDRIRKEFPDLVASGEVVVYQHACVPMYDAEDMKRSAEVDGAMACSSLDVRKGARPEHTNLVTPKMDGSANEGGMSFQSAALTAVKMVPDAGPWIVHMDLHPGNVLYKRVNGRQKLALADWGNALIVDSPNDVESVRKGIREWMASYGGSVDDPTEVLVSNLEGLDWPVARHMSALLTDPVDAMEEHMVAIRGWAVYTVLGSSNPDLLTATSQAELRSRIAPTGGMYWPAKYHRGLTQKQNAQRKRSATRRAKMSWKNPKAYVPWATDTKVKTRRSSYTQRFHKKYPGAKTLPEIAKATGISKSVLQTVYDRGMAAWRTGHRPGASQHAWGMARVHSFVMKGKTYRTADADLAKRGHT